MKKAVFLIVLIFALPVFGQTINTWRNYTNMENVNDVYALDGIVWAATSGGVFSYNLEDGSFNTYNKAEGLTEFNATAISIDNFGRIWIGFNNGVINVYNPETGSVRAILDLYNSEKNQPRINDIFIQNDTVFVSANFGISLINTRTFSFYDSFAKFGTWNYDSKINSVYYDKGFFIAGVNGIAMQKSGAVNLASPDSWQVYQTGAVNKIFKYNGQYLAAASGGLLVFQNSAWTSFLPEFTGRNIQDITIAGNTLLILSNNEVWEYNNGALALRTPALNAAVNLIAADNAICLSTNKGILITHTNGEHSNAYPNGPAGNIFPDMEIDNNGVLWCATATTEGKGIYRFDGSSWSSLNTDNSNIPSNNIFRINISSKNEVYVSSWGFGFAALKNNSFQTINSINHPALIPNNMTSKYLVIGDIAFDNNGDTWFLNSHSLGNKHLIKYIEEDDSLDQYINLLQPSAGIIALSLVIDQYNTKWFASLSHTIGLYYYNEDIKLPGSSSGWGRVDLGGTTTANTINSLILDNRGELWIGKATGLSIIADPQNPSSVTFSYPMHEETINCIAVDAINQKWVGTNRGVFLLSQDGSALLKDYNTGNSPILSDVIKSIAIDKKKGIVYIGTDNGLTAFSSEYLQPEDVFSEITIYPSPFIIPSESAVTINGLIKDSEIKIFNLTGKLIKEFVSPGGKIAFWDGRDSDGKLVGSGIYIVTAYDAEGNNVSTAKMAIIRE